ncbi:hypothetical protein B0A54_02571 [Friedmanniomyces endolithicus]|uniref:Uncharacterized protein n=1 Tax=Friedmanniomyces endolithicus TaxID=329885 RepID=A0A4U0VE02_9PEZI|nr:hypothetical protein B0A54_02571 [Friedmanniomyces endolithicus]
MGLGHELVYSSAPNAGQSLLLAYTASERLILEGQDQQVNPRHGRCFDSAGHIVSSITEVVVGRSILDAETVIVARTSGKLEFGSVKSEGCIETALLHRNGIAMM